MDCVVENPARAATQCRFSVELASGSGPPPNHGGAPFMVNSDSGCQSVAVGDKLRRLPYCGRVSELLSFINSFNAIAIRVQTGDSRRTRNKTLVARTRPGRFWPLSVAGVVCRPAGAAAPFTNTPSTVQVERQGEERGLKSLSEAKPED